MVLGRRGEVIATGVGAENMGVELGMAVEPRVATPREGWCYLVSFQVLSRLMSDVDASGWSCSSFDHCVSI